MCIMKNTLYFYRWYCYIVCVTTFLFWKHMYYTTPLLLRSLRPQHLRAASLQLDSLLHHHLTYERIFLRQCILGILGHRRHTRRGLTSPRHTRRGHTKGQSYLRWYQILAPIVLRAWVIQCRENKFGPGLKLKSAQRVGWWSRWMEATTRVVTTLRYLAHLSAGEIVTVPNCQKTLRQKI